MTLAADVFRCPGSRCPEEVRQDCRRYMEREVNMGPRTPWCDVHLGSEGPCPYKLPRVP